MIRIHALLNSVFPAYCCLCALPTANAMALCDACALELPVIKNPCLGCGLSLAEGSPVHLPCGRCLKKPPLFARLLALFAYQTPVRELIHAIKFQQKLNYAHLFGQLLLQKIQTEWYSQQALPQALLPVPLHKQRLRSRGYNQALEIIQPVAKQLGIPLLKAHCQRHKSTLTQTGLLARDRALNVKSAFSLTRPITVKHLAIVDDVVTTGYTLHALCSVLKTAGVETIDVWCCARTE